MILELKRIWHLKQCTIGTLSIDGLFVCYTLEDVTRPYGIKIPGNTAIPEGEYEVTVDWSNRFQRFMPKLLEVPGFEGIRIHAGNTHKDTSGCILVGMEKDIEHERILRSREAYGIVYMEIIGEVQKKHDVNIKISGGLKET
jgi:hypothetical protein